MRFEHPTAINHVITKEDIRYGQIVRAYEVDGLRNGSWEKLLEGQSVGYKRIDRMPTVEVTGLRLRVTEAVAEPVIKSFAAYFVAAEPEGSTEEVQSATSWREIDQWKEVVLTQDWKAVDIDLTPYIPTPGQYEIEFRGLDEQGSLEVKRAVPVMGGNEAERLIETLDRPLAWNVNRTAQITPDEKGRTALRMVVRETGRQDRGGRMFIRGPLFGAPK